MTAAGLVLAIASALAINVGYAVQHAAAAALPPLSLRAPLRSLRALVSHRRWLAGFLGGIGGWVLYVAALRLAPLSIVQAAAAGGIGVLALGARPRRSELLGVAAALAGLLLLGLSLGRSTTTHGHALPVAAWLLVSLGAAAGAAALLPRGAGLGTAAGTLYAAGDVATKAAVAGGARLLFVPAVLGAHGAAFACLQLAFQRGTRLATAGPAVLWTNALPILAGALLFGEGWGGPLRVAAFALVLAGAVALSGPGRAEQAV